MSSLPLLSSVSLPPLLNSVLARSLCTGPSSATLQPHQPLSSQAISPHGTLYCPVDEITNQRLFLYHSARNLTSNALVTFIERVPNAQAIVYWRRDQHHYSAPIGPLGSVNISHATSDAYEGITDEDILRISALLPLVVISLEMVMR